MVVPRQGEQSCRAATQATGQRRDFRLGRGPARLIELGLLDALRNAGCDVEVDEIALPTDGFTPDTRVAVDLQAAIAERATAARRRGAFPLVLAGNCGTSVGTVAGVTAATGSRPVVFWFDAHGDLNTPETTTTGFLDGMALAMLTGRCWQTVTPLFRSELSNRVGPWTSLRQEEDWEYDARVAALGTQADSRLLERDCGGPQRSRADLGPRAARSTFVRKVRSASSIAATTDPATSSPAFTVRSRGPRWPRRVRAQSRRCARR